MFLTLTLFGISSVAIASPKPGISEIPAGVVSGDTYSNEFLGIHAEIPRGWEVHAIPNSSLKLDNRNPDAPINQCSKVLLLLEAPAPVRANFDSAFFIFAMDPRCFPGNKFPDSDKDLAGIQKFAKTTIATFSHSPFISPNGADYGAERIESKLVIRFVGDMMTDASEVPAERPRGPVHVNLMLSVTESNGYWVAWSAVADDGAKEILKNARMQLRVGKRR
jgi:hypothetical protein